MKDDEIVLAFLAEVYGIIDLTGITIQALDQRQIGEFGTCAEIDLPDAPRVSAIHHRPAHLKVPLERWEMTRRYEAPFGRLGYVGLETHSWRIAYVHALRTCYLMYEGHHYQTRFVEQGHSA